MFKFKLLLLAFVVKIVTSQDWCDPKLCPAGINHIACNNSGNFSSSCPPDRTLVPLLDDDIKLILDTHNGLRNKIANGSQPGFLPAKRMATMVNYLLVPKEI